MSRISIPARLPPRIKKRPLSEQERQKERYTLRLPRRWGPKFRRPRSLWFFDIHRTRWKTRNYPKAWRLRRALKLWEKCNGGDKE